MRWAVHFSGGYDSTAVAIWCKEHGIEVYPIFYNYQQKYAAKEEWAALELAQVLELPPKVYKFSLPMHVQSNTKVPEYVPLRNLVMIAHSVHFAAANGCEAVAVGFKSERAELGNPYSFRDAGVKFLDDMNAMVAHISEFGTIAPRVVMPLLGWSKKDVVRYVYAHDISVEQLWNCYEAGPEPCGKCAHCVELHNVHEQLVDEGIENGTR